VAPPFREAEFDIIYGDGISREGSLIDIGEANGILTKSGTWFSYGETRLAQGRENTRQILKASKQLSDEIEAKIKEKLNLAWGGTGIIREEPVATKENA
jgi:recombination protein RecA